MPDKSLDAHVDEMIASSTPDGESIDITPPRIRCKLCGEILTADAAAKQCDVLGVRGKAGRPDPAIAISADAELIAAWLERDAEKVAAREDGARAQIRISLATRIRAGEWRR